MAQPMAKARSITETTIDTTERTRISVFLLGERFGGILLRARGRLNCSVETPCIMGR